MCVSFFLIHKKNIPTFRTFKKKISAGISADEKFIPNLVCVRFLVTAWTFHHLVTSDLDANLDKTPYDPMKGNKKPDFFA